MPYLKASQIEASMTALATGFQTVCKKTALPNATVSEGGSRPTISTTYSFSRSARAAGPNRRTVLAVAGLPRPRMGPARRGRSASPRSSSTATRTIQALRHPGLHRKGGSTYGPVTIPASKIAAMVDRMDILLVPCANPDGRKFSQSKKANNAGARPAPRGRRPGPPSTVGVDPNRNFDIAWDYDLYYTPAFAASGDLMSSKFASCGHLHRQGASRRRTPRHPDHEPEAKNLVWLLDNNPVTWSIDLHSYSMLLMHPWGIERNGTVPTQNFRNTAFDMTRDGTRRRRLLRVLPRRPAGPAARQAQAGRREHARRGQGRDRPGLQDRRHRRHDLPGHRHLLRLPLQPAVHHRRVAADPRLRRRVRQQKDSFQPHPTSKHGYPLIEREVHAVLLALLARRCRRRPRRPPAAGRVGGGSEVRRWRWGGGNGDGCLLSSAALVLAAARRAPSR